MRREPLIAGIRRVPRLVSVARSIARDVDDELRFHLESRVQELVTQGMSQSAAEERARREYGDLAASRAELAALDARRLARERRHLAWDSWWQDVRFAARALRRSPGFTIAAALTLMIGIGATAAMFSVVDAYLIRPLPFPQGDRLVELFDVQQRGADLAPASLPELEDWRADLHGVTGIAGVFRRTMTWSSQGEAERVRVGLVSEGYFELLGVRPVAGRLFGPDDHRAGAVPVLVLSRTAAEQRFAGAAAAIGAHILLDDRSYTVIGVIERAIDLYPGSTEAWVPLEPNAPWRDRGTHFLTVLGRLSPGVSLDAARRDLAAVARRIDERARTGHAIAARPLRDELVGNARHGLLVLFAAVGCLLLIAAVNVAGLMQARATARAHELAVRAALGAGRWRLLRQGLVEGLLVAILGGTLGALAAWWGVHALLAAWPSSLARPFDIAIDRRVLAFAAGVTIAAAIGAGLASGAGRAALARLRERGAAPGLGRRRGRHLLVCVEITAAMVLVTDTGLLMRSLARLLSVDPGFQPVHVLTAEVSLPLARYQNAWQRQQFFNDLLDRIRHEPGVIDAAVVLNVPLGSGGMSGDIAVEGRAFPRDHAPVAWKQIVSPTYFATMQIPLREGRTFTDRDRIDSRPVVIVNEEMARRLWPGESAIGKHIRTLSPDTVWEEIVGVVGNVHVEGLDRTAPMEAYRPLAQIPQDEMALVVRAQGDESPLSAVVRRHVHALDVQATVRAIQPLDRVLTESVAGRRMPAILLTGFSAVALLLAAVGLYGVLAFSVGQRVPEIGIRMALGADQRTVLRMIIGEGIRIATVGIAAGAVVGAVLSHAITHLLFGVPPIDAGTYGAAGAVLVVVAIAASLGPARRASRIPPMRALRAE